MRRDPSLHITRSNLIQVLTSLEFNGRISRAELADMIFKESQTLQIRDRYLDILQLKAKGREKAVRSQKADAVLSIDKIEKFHTMLMTYRLQQNKNLKIKPIHQTDRDYLLLKDVARQAYEFAQHFEINNPNEGVLEYIKLGLKFMGRKYALNKFKSYERRIYEYFEAFVFVTTDPDYEATREFYDIWKEQMLENDTMLEDVVNITDDYAKYANMVYGRMDADQANADYSDWVIAQFEGLKFLNVLPELGALHGENALNRYNRYLQESVVVESKDDTNILNMYDGYKDTDD